MITYTIKQNIKGDFSIYNENSENINFNDILTIRPDARIYTLNGQMGIGKTTLIKQLCKELNCKDIVNSPTFSIINVYETTDGNQIYHLDCYRLKDITEAINIGIYDYIYSNNYCFIEWPDLLSSILPDNVINIKITAERNGDRKLIIK